MLISRSVFHRAYPPKKGMVRATSHITGFVIRPNPTSPNGCILGYVAHCDPQGKLPSWLVNKVTHTLGPRMVGDLKKAAQGYVHWKSLHNNLKPWRFPEHITSNRISVDDVSTKLCEGLLYNKMVFIFYRYASKCHVCYQSPNSYKCKCKILNFQQTLTGLRTMFLRTKLRRRKASLNLKKHYKNRLNSNLHFDKLSKVNTCLSNFLHKMRECYSQIK